MVSIYTMRKRVGSLWRRFYIVRKKIRRMIFTNIALRTIGGCGSDLSVNYYSRLTPYTYLGDNCNFNGCYIAGEGRVTIGNNFHSGKHVQMITSFHNYDGGCEIPYDDTEIHKDISIGDQVWLGNNVIILGGVSIAEGAIIQAGSVVVDDIPFCAIAGGAPAKVFKYRNIEHYNQLKQLKKFH